MNNKSTILVPVDFRIQSMAAFEYAKVIAKATNCSLTLLYVIEETGIFTSSVLKKEQKAEIIKQAEARLDELVSSDKDLKERNIEAKTVIKKGKVYRKIINLANEIKPLLIIMGRTNSSDFKKNITGTNTHHIVSEAKIPVITIKGCQEVTTDDHILLPLDLTHPVKKKIAKAIEVAKYFGARVSILSVLQSNWLSKKIKFQKSLEEIQKIFTKYEVESDIKLKVCKKRFVYEIINEHAEEIGADLIMMMTQKEMDIHQYFIGSTAQDIINHSELPVLTIIPQPELQLNIKHYLFKELVDPLHVYNVFPE
jgi:nucleotide-binding universal stress UspA family protein